MKHYLLRLILLSGLMLSACRPVPPALPPTQADLNPTLAPPATLTAVETATLTLEPVSASPEPTQPPQHVDVLDITHLKLGDRLVSTGPQHGYVFNCMSQFNGGGATGIGNWMNGDGTWDLSKKITVDGSVNWPHSFNIAIQNGQRVFTSNDLPDHPTGNFPISSSDDAYAIDRNPNGIKTQNISFSVPANPTLAAQPTCIGGEVGIMLSGVLIFSAFDAEGRDAVAYEVQDNCNGHPQKDGFYHYHSLSQCFEDGSSGHSALMGYAFDGFGIYGYYGSDGRELTTADLDECHGHSHEILWDGQLINLYHYHATREFPYVVGCFKGTPSVKALSAENSGQAGQGAVSSVQPQQGGQGQGQQPPQEAINACLNLSQGAACSFNVPNGTLTGSCQLPPNQQQLICAPLGGPP